MFTTKTGAAMLTVILLLSLSPFAAQTVFADEPKRISPEAFVKKFNMRTVVSSYGQRLKSYCERFPRDYFSTVHYVSDTELALYNGTDYWRVTFEGDNRVTLFNEITDASYESQKSFPVAYVDSLDEWRADEVKIQRVEDCKPFKLDRQISFGNEHYKFEKMTTYRDNHDPGYVELGNGEEVQVSFDSIPWKEVDAWPEGKPVSIIYELDRGIRFQDPESGRSLPVFYYSGESPLDQIEEACIAVAGDTMAYAGCYGLSLRAWDVELNRNYKALMSIGDDQEKAKIRAAQRQWIEYRDAQLDAVGLISRRPGTIWTIRAAAIAKGITQEQAERLGNLIP
ncbi:lysozyme inhibitor LprI family protein [Marinobacter salarius]